MPDPIKGAIVRRTYSLPPDVDDMIERIRNREAVRELWLNQSEIVRAGLCMLDTLTDVELKLIVDKIPRVKRGRPGRGE